jgi:hypothetical protein
MPIIPTPTKLLGEHICHGIDSFFTSSNQDYMDSVQFDFDRRRDFDRVYLEIWKRIAKDKVRFVLVSYCFLVLAL